MKARNIASASAAASILAASLGSMSTVLAESSHVFSANVALTSNYMFRGVSQTNNGPAVQGGFDYEYSPYNLYAGVWASNVDSSSGAYVFEDPVTGEISLTPQTDDALEIELDAPGYDGASMELDIYAGWAPSWQGIDFDLGYLRYQYPMTDTSDNNTNEYHLGLAYDVEGYFTPGFTAYYSDDWFGSGPSWYYDLNVEVPLPYDFTLAGHYGWNRFDDSAGNYDDYSAGISKEYLGFGFDLSWVSRNRDSACSAPFQCGDTAVFTVSKSF